MPTQVRRVIDGVVAAGGRSLLNAIYPNEFEYYAITLELTDSEGKTIDFLTFPVNPNMIEFDDVSNSNIKKTHGGVNVLHSASFIPKPYMIKGSFGRKLRILITESAETPESTSRGNYDVSDEFENRSSILSSKIKSGYGTNKILEAIAKKSRQLDQYNKPMRLYLYNPAMGHSFLVNVNSLKFSQDVASSNMIWNYTLMMTAISPLEKLSFNEKTSSLKTLTRIGLFQKLANTLASNIRSFG